MNYFLFSPSMNSHQLKHTNCLNLHTRFRHEKTWTNKHNILFNQNEALKKTYNFQGGQLGRERNEEETYCSFQLTTCGMKKKNFFYSDHKKNNTFLLIFSCLKSCTVRAKRVSSSCINISFSHLNGDRATSSSILSFVFGAA